MMSLAQNESANTITSGLEGFLGKADDSTLGDDEDVEIEVPKTTPVCFLAP